MTTLKKRILSGMFALALGLTMAAPGRALADDWRHSGDNEWREHHNGDRDDTSRWRHDHDGDRDDASRGYYRNWHRLLPRNGEGRINPRNPNLYWACNSEGHHCHWASRF